MPPGPRKEPQPILLVYTLYASKRTCGMLYGPRTMVRAISELRGWQAQPVSTYMRARRATRSPADAPGGGGGHSWAREPRGRRRGPGPPRTCGLVSARGRHDEPE